MRYTETRRVNSFIRLIGSKIMNPHDLKVLYRELLKKTHPDSAGSDKYLKDFLNLREDYEEALKLLKNSITYKTPSRYSFFIHLYELENLELPINRTKENKLLIDKKEQLLWECDISWLSDIDRETFRKALNEYRRIRREKPYNDLDHLRTPLFYDTLRPWLHNLCRYHLTGKAYYIKSMKRGWQEIIPLNSTPNPAGIDSSFFELLKALYEDYKKGPALDN